MFGFGKQKKTDAVGAQVDLVVDRLINGSEDQVRSAFLGLDEFDSTDVFQAMFHRVIHATDNADLDLLLSVSEPLTEHRKEITQAIRANDMPALIAITGEEDLAEVYTKILLVIASFTAARQTR